MHEAKAIPAALCLLVLAACGGGGGTTPTDGGKADMAVPADLVATMDLSGADQTPGPLTCGQIIACVNQCQQCFSECVNKGSDAARQKFLALIQCIGQACPSMNNGVCDTAAPNYSQTACDACFLKSQDPGGACYDKRVACGMDM